MSHKCCCAVLLGLLLLWPNAAGYSADEKQAGTKAGDAAQKDDSHPKRHGAAHGPEIGEEGVNKDPSEFRQDLAIFTFLVFLILLAILWRFAWGPIAAALDKREEAIRKAIEDAELARKKAEQMLAEHAAKLDKVQDEVREILAEARRDAEHTKQDIVSHAQKEAEAAKQRAILEIERARDGALHELFEAMATQVADATEHVLGRTVNENDQVRLIEEALAQFPRK